MPYSKINMLTSFKFIDNACNQSHKKTTYIKHTFTVKLSEQTNASVFKHFLPK